jgi:hypothetical protein
MSNPNGNPATLQPPWGPNNPPPISPGRPRKRPLSEAYEDWLREIIPATKVAELRAEGIKLKAGATNADMVALAQGRQAIKGNVNAAKELREAVEGKATQRIELAHADRTPRFEVVYASPVPGAKTIEMEKVIEMLQGGNGSPIEVVAAPETRKELEDPEPQAPPKIE